MTEHQVIEARAAQPLAAAPQQFHSPAALMMQAAQSGMSPETIEKMMDLQLRFEAEQARRAYVDDFSKFAAERPSVTKNKQVGFESRRTGGSTSYKHETLDNLVDTVGPVLARHGFAHSWNTVQNQGRITVTCTLTHRLGHKESVTMDASPDTSGTKNAIQSVASAITFLQRYTFRAVTGVATTDEYDDDGRGADVHTQAPAINPELLQSARDAAMGGWASLREFNLKLTEAQRTELSPEGNNLKAAAKQADAAKNGGAA